MSLSNLSLYFIVVLVTCITPGAGVLYTLKNAVNYGRRNAYLSPTGNALGVLVMSVIAASGLGAIISSSSLLFYSIQICGCALLIWFGWKSWTAPGLSIASSLKALSPQENKKERLHILTSAALLQVTNPMLIVFLLSLLPQFIDQKTPYAIQLTVLIAIFVITCWLVHLVYSYSAATAAERWMSKNFSIWLNRVGAILFWFIAVSILLKLFGQQMENL